jgi:hypothetical protein
MDFNNHRLMSGGGMEKTETGIAVQRCDDFELVWNDKGSGGTHHGAFYTSVSAS